LDLNCQRSRNVIAEQQPTLKIAVVSVLAS
jgi:hypothetical protein